MAWFYQAYGLSVKSEFELDELTCTEPMTQDYTDLRIETGAINSEFLNSLTPIHPQVRVGPRGFWLNIPNVAAYAVIDGSQILVEQYPKSDFGAVKLWLLGSCMGAVLWQRGFTVLHGNAVKIGTGVVICVGHSGAGKSTLAAEFARRGYMVIADDVVAIDQSACVVQGIPRIKLWQNSLDYFKINSEELFRIRSGEDKYSVAFQTDESDLLAPIDWIFVLEPHDCDYPYIEIIPALDCLPLLFEHSYRPELVSGFGLQQSHFLKCVKIASRANIARVKRPKIGFLLNELCDEIINFIELNS